jgi:hypothetical protein
MVVGGVPDRFLAGVACVKREFFVAVQDAEGGVFDDHGDDFAGVRAPDSESLSGNHSDAVVGDTALDSQRTRGSHLRQRTDGRARAADVGQCVVR